MTATTSVRSIDVGYDVRLHGIIVLVHPDTTCVLFDDSLNKPKEVTGSFKRIVAVLRRHGYRVNCNPVRRVETE
jgi:sulfite reductase beta subunit-like hemoprotein